MFIYHVRTFTISLQIYSRQSAAVQGEKRGNEDRQNVGEEEMIKYLSPHSTTPPHAPAALNPISNKGGDVSEQGRASLPQASDG